MNDADYDKLMERMFRHIDVRQPDACWPWKKKPSRFGYGRTSFQGVEQNAHRIVWIAANRMVAPKGAVVMHTCDNRICCNPAHLRLGTQKENMADCLQKGRYSRDCAPKGEQHGRSKLSASDVLRIRSNNMRPKQIQAEFGVSQSHAYALVAGTFWRHLQ